MESARMVQQPLNPAVIEAARQLLDRTSLRWPEALQLGAAVAARDMFQGTEIVFVSASAHLLGAAAERGIQGYGSGQGSRRAGQFNGTRLDRGGAGEL